MQNDKFWNECTDGSLRQKIAEFIDKNKTVSHLKGTEYYDFEDALVELIKNNRNLIAKEVDAEYHREDLLNQVKEDYGAEAVEVFKALPISVIDDLVATWQEELEDNEDYRSIAWNTLSETLSDGVVSPFAGLDEYPSEEVLTYAAYVKLWYDEMTPEMEGQAPACIEEFFTCEMCDDELSAYYTTLAADMFGDKIKK